LKDLGWVHRLGLKISRQGAYPQTPHAVLGFFFWFLGSRRAQGAPILMFRVSNESLMIRESNASKKKNFGYPIFLGSLI
jgi:hypothetical protein